MTSPQVASEPQQTGTVSAPTRVYYFDYLRMWATIGVVSVHAGAGITATAPHGRTGIASEFNAGNLYDSFGRFGVGCFFMISGALLLDPRHTFRLPKQLLRVFVPLVVWSAVVVAVNYVLAYRHDPVIGGSSLKDPENVGHAVTAFFAGPLAYHFWFVYVLIGIYLARLLRPLHHHGIPLRGRAVPAAVYAAIAGLALVATFVLVWRIGTHPGATPWPYHNLTPEIVGYAAGVFLFAKAVMDRPGRCYPFVALFSRLSYRIYLMHVILLHYFRHFSPLHNWYYDQPVVALAVAVAFTVGASFVIAWLIDQVRPIRNYV